MATNTLQNMGVPPDAEAYVRKVFASGNEAAMEEVASQLGLPKQDVARALMDAPVSVVGAASAPTVAPPPSAQPPSQSWQRWLPWNAQKPAGSGGPPKPREQLETEAGIRPPPPPPATPPPESATTPIPNRNLGRYASNAAQMAGAVPWSNYSSSVEFKPDDDDVKTVQPMSDEEAQRYELQDTSYGREWGDKLIGLHRRLTGSNVRRAGELVANQAEQSVAGLDPKSIARGEEVARRFPDEINTWYSKNARNPVTNLPKSITDRLTQTEREDLWSFVTAAKSEVLEKRAARLSETAQKNFQEAEKVNPLWRALDEYQQRLAKRGDAPPSLMKTLALNDVSGLTDIAMLSATLQGDDEYINQVLNLRRAVGSEIGRDSKAIEGEGWGTKLAHDVAGMLPMMGRGAALNAIPGVGQILGTSMWAAQGAGDILGRVAEEGGDPKAALQLAVTAGIGYALIENMQVGQVLNSGLSGAVKGTIWKRVLRAVGEKGWDYVKENTEEVFQDIISDEGVKKALAAQGIKYELDPLMSRVRETLKGTLGPMGVLNALGGARGAGRGAWNAATNPAYRDELRRENAAARENAETARQAKKDVKAMDAGTYQPSPQARQRMGEDTGDAGQLSFVDENGQPVNKSWNWDDVGGARTRGDVAARVNAMNEGERVELYNDFARSVAEYEADLEATGQEMAPDVQAKINMVMDVFQTTFKEYDTDNSLDGESEGSGLRFDMRPAQAGAEQQRATARVAPTEEGQGAQVAGRQPETPEEERIVEAYARRDPVTGEMPARNPATKPITYEMDAKEKKEVQDARRQAIADGRMTKEDYEAIDAGKYPPNARAVDEQGGGVQESASAEVSTLHEQNRRRIEEHAELRGRATIPALGQGQERALAKIQDPEERDRSRAEILADIKEGFNDGTYTDSEIVPFKHFDSVVLPRLIDEHKKTGVAVTVETMDIGNQTAVNSKYHGDHGAANVDLRAIIGKRYIDVINSFGGIVSREKGDEFKVAWIGYTKAEVEAIRPVIEKEMREARKELKLHDVAYAKDIKKGDEELYNMLVERAGYNGEALYTGALHSNYGLSEVDGIKSVKELLKESEEATRDQKVAELVELVKKQKNNSAQAENIDYINNNKEGTKNEPESNRVSQRDGNDAGRVLGQAHRSPVGVPRSGNKDTSDSETAPDGASRFRDGVTARPFSALLANPGSVTLDELSRLSESEKSQLRAEGAKRGVRFAVHGANAANRQGKIDSSGKSAATGQTRAGAQKSKPQNEDLNTGADADAPAPITPRQFRRLLDRLGRTGLAKDVITDAEEMRERLAREFGEGAADRFMSVWHGSPHAFDKFSTAFMGSGEGNQSYGWGLYFTDLREIAEEYATGVDVRVKIFVDGEPLLSHDHPYFQQRAYQNQYDFAKLRSSLIRSVETLERYVAREDISEGTRKLHEEELGDYKWGIELIDSGRVAAPLPDNRNIYSVKIHGDKTVDDLNFIRWDKPLTDKNKTAIYNQAKKEKLGNFKKVVGDWLGGITYPGQYVYSGLSAAFKYDDKAASEFLLRAGIDGIQYPTGYKSKGSHEDSYNYVVFDDKALEIVEHIRLMSTPDGKVYGFATKDGKIYLDPAKMNANTPIHEYGHLWVDFVKEHNRPLYDRLMAAAAGSEEAKALRSNPAYAHMSGRERAEEALARAIGNAGEARFVNERVGARFRELLRELWNWVAERLGLTGRGGLSGRDAESVGDMTFAEIAEGGARELLGGRRVGEEEGEASEDTEGSGGLGGGAKFAFIGERGAEKMDYRARQRKPEKDDDYFLLARIMERETADNKPERYDDITAITGWAPGWHGGWNWNHDKEEAEWDYRRGWVYEGTTPGTRKYYLGLKRNARWADYIDRRPGMREQEIPSAKRPKDAEALRMDNLKIAEAMEEEGKDEKTIKMATGWERGADRKWRYEIMDIHLSDNARRLLDDAAGARLERIVGNDKGLFTAYPQLRGVTIKVDEKLQPGEGYYRKGAFGDIIAISEDAVDSSDLIDVLVHEIQHGIQEIEGFARGGSIAAFIPKETREKWGDTSDDDRREAYIGASQQYQRLAGEVEARNAAKRLKMGEDTRRQSPARNTEDVPRDKQTVRYDRRGEATAEADAPKAYDIRKTGGGYAVDRKEGSGDSTHWVFETKFSSQRAAADYVLSRGGTLPYDHALLERAKARAKKRPEGGAGEQLDLFGSAVEAGVPAEHLDKYPNARKRAREEWEEKGMRSPFFKRWFGDSKVVDGNGEPLVVYHQTGSDNIDVFDPRRVGAGQFDNEMPFGIFLKPHDRDIGLVGKRQMALYAKITNPLRVADRAEMRRYLEDNIEGYAELRDRYDSVDKDYTKRFADIEAEFDRRFEEWEAANADATPSTETGLDTRQAAMDRIEKETGYDTIVDEWRGAENDISAQMKELVDAHFRGSGYDGIVLERDEGGIGKATTKTFVAFDSNQVKSATDNAGTFDGGNPDIRFDRRGKSPEGVNRKFNAELQRQIDGTLPAGHVYRMGRAGAILRAAGIPDLDIELNAARLRGKSEQANHPFDLSDMMNLPDAVQNPLAVFDSATREGSFVILTELTHGNENYVAVLQANKRDGNLLINSIRSIYPKENRRIAHWITGGLLKYADKKGMADWISKQRSNSADVENPFSQAKDIIDRFENPELATGRASKQRSNSAEVGGASDRIIDNIGDSGEKVNSEDEKNSSGDRTARYSPADEPAPITPRQFRRLLDRLGRTGLAKDVITDAEEMRKRLAREFGEGAADRFMSVWHGSPHAFDKFSTAFMGSGEGAQSYGWGLYFTDLRKIAEGYAKMGRGRAPKLRVNGEVPSPSTYNRDTPEGWLAGEVAGNSIDNIDALRRYVAGMLKNVKGAIDRSGQGGYPAKYIRQLRAEAKVLEEALGLLDAGKVTIEAPTDSLYNVKFHGDKTVDGLNFIRWDKPLTVAQAEAIARRLSKELTGAQQDVMENLLHARRGGKQPTGRDIYNKLTTFFFMDGADMDGAESGPKAASEFLLRAGIDGIQYPTGYKSKGSHEDSYNYVVFDDKALEIVEHIRLMSTPDGEVYGFATKGGKIYLDPAKMNANTPIHEYGHLWVDFVKEHNRPLYDRLMAAAAGSEDAKALRSNPAYAHLSGRERAEEALARAIGNAGEARFVNERVGARFRELLRELWNWVAERLGLTGRGGLSEMDAEDVGDMTLAEIAEGGARELLGGRRVGGGDGAGGGNYIKGGDSQIEGREELMAKAEMYQEGMSVQDAKDRLYALIGGAGNEIMLQNDNDGDEARLNKKSIEKLMAGDTARKSVNNGFTWGQHYAVASDIDNIYRRAVKVWSHPDKYGNKDVVIHRFATPLHFNDAVAYITVKESVLGGKKMYSTELMEIKRLEGMLEEAGGTSRRLPSSSQIEGRGILADAESPSHDRPALGLYTDNIRKIFDAVNSQDEDSSKNIFDGEDEGSGLRFDKRTISKAERERRAKDPRWQVTQGVSKALRGEGIFSLDLERPGNISVERWRKMVNRAMDSITTWARNDPHLFADAGFPEAYDTEAGVEDRFNPDDVIDRIKEWRNDFDQGIYHTGEVNEEPDQYTAGAREAAFASLTEGLAPHEKEARGWDGYYQMPELEHAPLERLARQKSGGGRISFTNAGEEFTARRGKDGGWIIENARGKREELEAGAKVWVDKGHLKAEAREGAAKNAEADVKRAEAAIKKAEQKRAEADARKAEADREAETARAKANRLASETARVRAQAAADERERAGLEAEKAAADLERAREERKTAEAKAAALRAEADKARAETEKIRLETRGKMADARKAMADKAKERADKKEKRAKFDASPVTRITGDEIFKWAEPLDMKGVRAKVIPWMEEQGHFRNDYVNSDTGWDNIAITRNGVVESLQHFSGPEKVQAFAALPDMIKGGILIRTSPSDKEGQRDMKEHIFAAKVDIGGSYKLVGFVVKEDSNGRRFYDHEMTEIKNLDGLSSHAGAAGLGTGEADRTRQGSKQENLDGRPSQGGADSSDTGAAFRTHQDKKSESIINIIQKILGVNTPHRRGSDSYGFRRDRVRSGGAAERIRRSRDPRWRISETLRNILHHLHITYPNFTFEDALSNWYHIPESAMGDDAKSVAKRAEWMDKWARAEDKFDRFTRTTPQLFADAAFGLEGEGIDDLDMANAAAKIAEWQADFANGDYKTAGDLNGMEKDPLIMARRAAAMASLTEGLAPHEAEAKYWDGYQEPDGKSKPRQYDMPKLEKQPLELLSKRPELKAGGGDILFTNASEEFAAHRDAATGEWIIEDMYGGERTLPPDAEIFIDEKQNHEAARAHRARVAEKAKALKRKGVLRELQQTFAREFRRINFVRGKRASTWTLDANKWMLNLIELTGQNFSETQYKKLQRLTEFYQNLAVKRKRENRLADVDEKDREWVETSSGIPEWVVRETEALFGAALEDLTMEQALEIQEDINEKRGKAVFERKLQLLADMAERRNNIKAAIAQMGVDEDRLDTGHTITADEKQKRRKNFFLSKWDFVRGIGWGAVRGRGLMRYFDGTLGKKNAANEPGMIERLVGRPIFDSADNLTVGAQIALDEYMEILKDIDVMAAMKDVLITVMIPSKSGKGKPKPKKITYENAMFVYQHSRNEDNRRHLIGTQYTEDDADGNPGTITQIVNALPQKYKDAVDKMFEFYEKQGKQMAPVYEREHNAPMIQVPWYAPIRDLYLPPDATLGDVIKAEDDYRRQASVKKGMTKGRITSDKPFNNERFFTYNLAAILEAQKYIAGNDAVRQANKYLLDKELAEAMIEKNEPAYKELKQWVTDWAAPDVEVGGLDKIFEALGSRTTITKLAGNMLSWMKQPESILNALPELSPVHLTKAVAAFGRHPLATPKFAKAKSPMMRDRSKNIEQIYSDAAKTGLVNKTLGIHLSTKQGVIENAVQIRDTFNSLLMIGIPLADSISSSIVWTAKYGGVLEKTGDEAKAIRAADDLVARTQSIGGPLHSPSSFRARGFTRTFTMFRNDANQGVNLLFETLWGWKNRPWYKTALLLAYRLLIPALYEQLISTALTGTPPDEPEDYIEMAVGKAVGGIPMYGDIVKFGGTLAGNASREYFGRDKAHIFSAFGSSPAQDFAERLARMGNKGFSPEDIAMVSAFILKVGGEIPYTRYEGVKESGDWRRVAWSKYALTDRSVEAAMVKRADKSGMEQRTDKWGLKGKQEFEWFNKWYGDLDQKHKEAFDRYYERAVGMDGMVKRADAATSNPEGFRRFDMWYDNLSEDKQEAFDRYYDEVLDARANSDEEEEFKLVKESGVTDSTKYDENNLPILPDMPKNPWLERWAGKRVDAWPDSILNRYDDWGNERKNAQDLTKGVRENQAWDYYDKQQTIWEERAKRKLEAAGRR